MIRRIWRAAVSGTLLAAAVFDEQAKRRGITQRGILRGRIPIHASGDVQAKRCPALVDRLIECRAGDP